MFKSTILHGLLLYSSNITCHYSSQHKTVQYTNIALRCVIPIVCVTNGREENVVKQHN